MIRRGKLILDGKCLFHSDAPSPEWALKAYEYFGFKYPRFYKMDLMGKLGFIAAECLMKEIDTIPFDDYRKGLILQNAQSSLYADGLYHQTLMTIPSPALFVYTLPNIVMGEIAIRHHFKGENTFFVQPEFMPQRMFEYADIMFQNEIVDLLLLGNIDFQVNTQDLFLCLVSRHSGAEMFTAESLNEAYSAEIN